MALMMTRHDTAGTLRRDNLLYLLSEIERALDQALPELSQEDVTTVGTRFERLVAKVVRRCDPHSD